MFCFLNKIKKFQHKEDVLFATLFGLLSLFALYPFWSVRIPPMQDIWQHLALVDVIHRYDDPDTIYAQYFLLPSSPKPNLIYYYFTHFLAYLFPLETANKIVISFYIVGFPLSAVFFFKTFQRSKWLALFSFLFVYNAMFGLGFASFVLGIPVLFVTVGFYRSFLQESNRILLKGIISAFLMVFAFFTHAHIYLLLVFICGLLLLMHRDYLWGTLYKAWPFLPSLVFFIPWFVVFFVEQTPSTSGIKFGTDNSLIGPFYYKPSQILSTFHKYLMEYQTNEVEEGIFILVILVAMILLIFRRTPNIPPKRESQAGWRGKVTYILDGLGKGRVSPVIDLEIITLFLGLSVFLLPHHIESQAIVSTRHIIFAVFFFFGWLGFDNAPKIIKVLSVVLIVALSCFALGSLTKGFKKFDEELDNYPSLFERAEIGKRLLKQAYSQDSKYIFHGALWHIHFFYMIEKGGISDVQFAEYPHNPIQYRPNVVPPKPPVDFMRSPSWRYFDYILLRKSSSPSIAQVEGELEMVSDVTDWVLYKVIKHPKTRGLDLNPYKGLRRGSTFDHSGIEGTEFSEVGEEGKTDTNQDLNLKKRVDIFTPRLDRRLFQVPSTFIRSK